MPEKRPTTTTPEQSDALSVHAEELLAAARQRGDGLGLKPNSAAIVMLIRALAMAVADATNGRVSLLPAALGVAREQLSDQVVRHFTVNCKGSV